jgi:hypothetical protein
MDLFQLPEELPVLQCQAGMREHIWLLHVRRWKGKAWVMCKNQGVCKRVLNRWNIVKRGNKILLVLLLLLAL